MHNDSVKMDILAKAYNSFNEDDYPFLRDYRSRVLTEKPYLGLKILHNVHLTLSTLCKIETLICGGADVVVTVTRDLVRSPDAMALLIEAGVPFVEEDQIVDDFDIVLDCCAGAYGKVSPRVGVSELTQTGSVIYKANTLAYPVISVDDSMTKNLENFYGTGDGFLRGINKLIPESIKAKKFLLFGYGKVGKGIIHYLSAYTDKIVVVEKRVAAIAEAVKSGYHGLYYNDFKGIENELKDTFCVVTATGEDNLLSNLYSKKIFDNVKYFANIGSHDELGSKFKTNDKRILNEKRPVNFCLEEPTRIKYLDPIFYLHNAAIDVFLIGPKQLGVYSFPLEKDLAVLRKWSSIHQIDTSVIFDEGYSTFTTSLAQNLLSYLPCYVYWKDKHSTYQGCNHLFAKAAGLDFPSQIVGKSDFDLAWGATEAELFQKSDREVMAGEYKINFIEPQYQADGTTKTVLASKVPYFDAHGNVEGVLGIYVDITDRQEKERLEIENEVNKNLLQEHEKFVKVADQVAHDIRSPLASLLMIVKTCTDIPETERVALREAAISIGDIANNLLSKYQKDKDHDASKIEQAESILVSASLLQLLTDKKYQYQEFSVKFRHDFTQKGNFAFIKVEPTAFKRMMSNLVNNAVDAFDKKEGAIILKLDADREWVKIIVEDNGKGMPPELVDKIMKNVSVTEGKKEGHGIGLTQVRETLVRSQGELFIDSVMGQGTKITLSFPRSTAPSWIAEEIHLYPQDVVVILDDDSSIHGAWDTHFEAIIDHGSKISIKHFEIGKDALEYITGLSENEKRKVFLLTDYELLKQGVNGLDVIAQSHIERSILVTSHYMNQLVQEQAAKTGTKILPKQLASEIPIVIDAKVRPESVNAEGLRQVDLVLVDDDKAFADTLIIFAFENKVVDYYQDPRHFMNNVAKYPKNTKIFLDNNFATASVKGINLAEQLHAQGYVRLYLLSGQNFSKGDIPSYLAVIMKDNLDAIKEI